MKLYAKSLNSKNDEKFNIANNKFRDFKKHNFNNNSKIMKVQSSENFSSLKNINNKNMVLNINDNGVSSKKFIFKYKENDSLCQNEEVDSKPIGLNIKQDKKFQFYDKNTALFKSFQFNNSKEMNNRDQEIRKSKELGILEERFDKHISEKKQINFQSWVTTKESAQSSNCIPKQLCIDKNLTDQKNYLKIKSANNTRYNNFLKNDFPINKYSNEINVSKNLSSSSSVILRPPKITLALIEREKHLMHEYVEQHFKKSNENLIFGKFGRPRINPNKQICVNSFNKTYSQAKEHNDYYFKEYQTLLQNPSIGPAHINKKFPDLSKNLKSCSVSKFNEKYSTKIFKQFLLAKRIDKGLESVEYPFLKKTRYAQVSKIKLKWKTIKWLMEQEKSMVSKLTDFHKKFLTNSENYDKSYTRQQFYELMRVNGISNNSNLINKLFWVFDENGDEKLKMYELALGLEMFRDSSPEEKIRTYFDLCDKDHSGSISKGEFLKMMRNNLVNNDEKNILRQIIDGIYGNCNLNEKGELSYDKLRDACLNNKALYEIIEQNLYALKSIDNIIDQELQNKLMIFNRKLSDDLKNRLLDVNTCYMPLRDKKFQAVMNKFIANKQTVLDYCLEKEERRSNNLHEEDYKSDALIFSDEMEHIRKLLRNMSHKK